MLKFEESRRVEERFLNFVLYFQNCSNVAENVDRIITVCTTGWKGGKKVLVYGKMLRCAPQKIKRCIIWSSKSIFGYTQGKERWGVLKQVFITVFLSRLFTMSQIYKKFINRFNKNVVYMHVRLLCNLAGSNLITFYNMDEPWGLYAKWSWTETKGKFWCCEKPLPQK